MASEWTINAGGRIYGPFSSDRMRSFAGEGRLAANSLVAHEGTTDWHEARTEPEFDDLFDVKAAPPGPVTPTSGTNDEQLGQFAVVVDMKTARSANFERAVASFGSYYQLLPNIWIVSTTQNAAALRDRLIQELGKSDSLFIIDASRGRASWFNFGPEADTCIRKVWQKAS